MLVMDFEQVLKALLQGFERLHIRYAACGGFALGVLGVPRATADVDFLIHQDNLETLHRWLVGLGYARKARTDNVSQYIHSDAAWGALDVLHAFRKHALAMLDRASQYPVFGGSFTVTVLQPEDVIGLKVQAMANDAGRLAKETVDIEALMEHYGARLDWDRIQEFYELFEFGDEGRRLHERFGHAER